LSAIVRVFNITSVLTSCSVNSCCFYRAICRRLFPLRMCMTIALTVHLYFYASGTVERYPRHTTFGSVRLWVSAWVRSENLVDSIYLKNQWREFHPILVTCVLGFVDGLTSFWDQKVKSQCHSRQWPEKLWTSIS